MTADVHAAEADALSRRYPGWTIWFGPRTGRWWALPPRERDVGAFVEAETPQRLIARIEVICHAESARPAPQSAQRPPVPAAGPATWHGPRPSESPRPEPRRPSNLLRLEGGIPSPLRRVPAMAWPGGAAR
ncbi:hypothetical protein [Actinomadura keratinilytica]|jgi:hypothetical protein|uniref:Uncharacterized protein n=1 Tax=Actinomadura keratinilytica TaxID=547461 RepID=A0ABP7YMX0_9ACTN